MTSGDLLADRRLAYALMVRGRGDAAAALSLIDEALERAPGWAEALFARAETLERLGRDTEAAEAYRACLARDPADRMGAGARLALLAGQTPQALPEAYLRSLFDQYAPRYDAALLGRLGYRAPVLLRAAVDAVAPPLPERASVLDLGCGTGLAGAAFRDRAGWLEGVDIAPAMIAEARRKGLYDRLTVGGIGAFLADPPRRYDLVVAADVFVYLGPLGPVLAAAARALAEGGLVAFTTQKGETEPFVLGPDQRYAHAPAHLRAAAAEAGLAVLCLDEASCRSERGRPVPGLLAVLRRPA